MQEKLQQKDKEKSETTTTPLRTSTLTASSYSLSTLTEKIAELKLNKTAKILGGTNYLLDFVNYYQNENPNNPNKVEDALLKMLTDIGITSATLAQGNPLIAGWTFCSDMMAPFNEEADKFYSSQLDKYVQSLNEIKKEDAGWFTKVILLNQAITRLEHAQTIQGTWKLTILPSLIKEKVGEMVVEEKDELKKMFSESMKEMFHGKITEEEQDAMMQQQLFANLTGDDPLNTYRTQPENSFLNLLFKNNLGLFSNLSSMPNEVPPTKPSPTFSQAFEQLRQQQQSMPTENIGRSTSSTPTISTYKPRDNFSETLDANRTHQTASCMTTTQESSLGSFDDAFRAYYSTANNSTSASFFSASSSNNCRTSSTTQSSVCSAQSVLNSTACNTWANSSSFYNYTDRGVGANYYYSSSSQRDNYYANYGFWSFSMSDAPTYSSSSGGSYSSSSDHRKGGGSDSGGDGGGGLGCNVS